MKRLNPSISIGVAHSSLIIGVISLFLMFTSVSFAHAAVFMHGEAVTVSNEIATPEDVYVAGSTVTVTVPVQGDVVAAGGTVTIQGPVTQDVMTAGGTTIILGSVGDDVRAVGGHITIGGEVIGDVIAAGGTITILPSAKIGGDVVAAGGMINIMGPVAGRVEARGGELTINNSVGKDVTVDVTQLSLGSTTQIAGALAYTSANQMIRADGSQITGEVSYTPKKEPAKEKSSAMAGIIAFLGFMAFIKMTGLTILALILLAIAKPFVTQVSAASLARPAMNGLLGFAAMILAPIACFIISITVVGLMVGATGFLAYMLLLMIAGAISMIFAGALLSKLIRGEAIINWKWTIIGGIAFAILTCVPFIGWLAAFILYFIVLGSTLRVLYEKHIK